MCRIDRVFTRNVFVKPLTGFALGHNNCDETQENRSSGYPIATSCDINRSVQPQKTFRTSNFGFNKVCTRARVCVCVWFGWRGGRDIRVTKSKALISCAVTLFYIIVCLMGFEENLSQIIFISHVYNKHFIFFFLLYFSVFLFFFFFFL